MMYSMFVDQFLYSPGPELSNGQLAFIFMRDLTRPIRFLHSVKVSSMFKYQGREDLVQRFLIHIDTYYRINSEYNELFFKPSKVFPDKINVENCQFARRLIINNPHIIKKMVIVDTYDNRELDLYDKQILYIRINIIFLHFMIDEFRAINPGLFNHVVKHMMSYGDSEAELRTKIVF